MASCAALIEDGDTLGVLLEVNCETDFVARNDDFGAFVDTIAAHIAAEAPGDVDELLGQSKDGRTIEEIRAEFAANTGENVVINRFARFEADGGLVASYVHHNGRVGVLVEVAGSGDLAEFAKEVASHAAATGAEHVSADDVPQEARDAELKVLKEQAAEEGKPPEVQEKIAEGRMRKWLEEVILLSQQHINSDKHDGKTIDALRKAAGENVEIRRFARFQIGG